MMRTEVSFSDRVDERFRALSSAIATRIDTAKGDLSQGDLGDRVGKGNPSISRDLNGDANLSLKTVIGYEVALDETVLSVPKTEHSATSRRRRRPEGGWTKPDVREDKVDPVTQRLHRLLTRLSRHITAEMQTQDLTQADLADRAGKSPSYVSRMLGGGVNVTLKTIAAFEVALDVHLLTVDGHDLEDLSGSYRTYETVPSLQESSDGGYCLDVGAAQAVKHSKYLIRTQQTEEEEELEAA
jgi:transcriptional regulator with XRE-family HTH domain